MDGLVESGMDIRSEWEELACCTGMKVRLPLSEHSWFTVGEEKDT